MNITVIVNKIASESFEGRKGRVTQNVATCLESKQDGGFGVQFFSFPVTEEMSKAGLAPGKKARIEADTIRQLFQGTAKLGDVKLIEVLK